MHKQIFHDPTGRRKLLLWTVMLGIAAILLATAGTLVARIATIEHHVAPAFPGHATRPAFRPETAAQARTAFTPADAPTWLPPKGVAGLASLRRVAFYMPWDEAGRTSLTENIGQLDMVVAGLATVHGAKHVWQQEHDPHLRAVLDRHQGKRLLVMVQNVDDNGRWDGANSARLFADRQERRRLLDRIDAMMRAERADGVAFDMEDLPTHAHDAYRRLLSEAKTRFTPRNLMVTIAAPVSNPAWNLRAYGDVVDHAFLMAYDEHWPGGAAGPIASQPWFAQQVASAVAAIGPDKAIVALGNYAYDWGAKESAATPMTVQQAWDKAVATGADIRFDPASGNSHFAYEEDGVRHQVWTVDATSSWNQLLVSRRLGVSGVALWRLGSEDEGFWKALATPPGSVPDIAQMPTVHGIDLRGSGEILRLSEAAAPGQRELGHDAHGLIRTVRYNRLPSANRVDRTGHHPRQIALTFDDGPDPAWTPRILDILRDAGAPATFFVTGANILGQPELVRRIVAQGSELGNHSTTHAELGRLPEAAIRLELNATQRLVESYSGRSMRLFRAPYLGDADPDKESEIRVARIAADMGYLTVGLNVDPLDWKATTAQNIVARTLAQVAQDSPTHSTRIVLLHDSGGDRSATIAALPHIISQLRARGFELVTVSRLAGIDRDAAMPPLTGPARAAASSSAALFSGVSGTTKILGGLFLFTIMLGMSRSILLTGLAMHNARHASPPNPPPHLVPRFVTVLIPAFNEEAVIAMSVRRVLSTQGPRVEIIVIDDGSRDRTSQIVRDSFGMDPRVTLLTLANGGKARALNRGLEMARGDIVIALDADTQFEPETIARLCRWFADPAIGAVAGNAKVGNRINLVTRWQAIEYVTAQNLERRALLALDAVTVVPGAVGAWRRVALDAVGGYPSDTLAEDQDLTIAIQRAGWKIACDPDAVAWTEAPDSWRGLFKQRYRWAFGTLQCLWKHRHVLIERTPKGLARFGLPQAWAFQIAFGLISPVIDLALLASIVDTAIRLLNHGFTMMQGDLTMIAGFWILFGLVDMTCGWLAYRLDGKETRFPAIQLLMQRMGYRQLLYVVVIRAVLSALAGPRVGWGKLSRSGTVVAPDLLSLRPEPAPPMPSDAGADLPRYATEYKLAV